MLQVPKSCPNFFPEERSSAGITTPSIVPGRTVLRITTVCHRSIVFSVAPISVHTRSMYCRSMLPFGRLGVPTQIREIVDERTASATSVVARSRPAATISATSSAIPSSRIVLFPALSMLTLATLTSTPTTSWPCLAKHAAETQPTYPRPKTLTVVFITSSWT